MEKYIYIEGDANDGNYIGRLSQISDEELKLITPVIKAVGDNKEHYNFPTYDGANEDIYSMYSNLDENSIEEFSCFVPHGEHGISTIIDIKLLQLVEQL